MSDNICENGSVTLFKYQTQFQETFQNAFFLKTKNKKKMNFTELSQSNQILTNQEETVEPAAFISCTGTSFTQVVHPKQNSSLAWLPHQYRWQVLVPYSHTPLHLSISLSPLYRTRKQCPFSLNTFSSTFSYAASYLAKHTFVLAPRCWRSGPPAHSPCVADLRWIETLLGLPAGQLSPHWHCGSFVSEAQAHWSVC